ncbi:MAG TPA: hypothetical protein VN538_07520 [Clostridia bacterium]|nr:hypothetical protein [Clostridia bacterium]
MDRPNDRITRNRWLVTRVVDLGKVPMKFFLIWGLYSAVAIIAIMAFLTAFSSGVIFGVPGDFAVDSEERIYLSYDSGIYVIDQGKRRAIWPNENGTPALSVSEDDMLTMANFSYVRVVDLAKSDFNSGRLEVVQSYVAIDNVLYSISMDQHHSDPQNGITYRYKGNSSYFEIFREENGKSELFYSMPPVDRAWTLAARIGFVMWIPYVLSAILLWNAYFRRHPEYTSEAPYLWKKRSN